VADFLTLILAAGKGTRMKSDVNKVLHETAGKSMVQRVLDQVQEVDSAAETVCIVGYQKKQVKQHLGDKDIKFVTQKEQLGTGHAVGQAAGFIARHQGPVLVLCADTPLLRADTIEKLTACQQQEDTGAAVLTAKLDDPSGYGRIVRNNKGHIKCIVEDQDASKEQKKIKEVNAGVYCFSGPLLFEALNKIDSNNEQQEYYLTDTVSYINNQSGKVIPVEVHDSAEIIGVNDRRDLARANKLLYQRTAQKHMVSGVTIIDPDNTYIEPEVKIGRDCVIHPFTFLQGDTEIGPHTAVGPYSRVFASSIGKNVQIKASCNIKESIVHNECTIGPFANLRPGTELKAGVKVGDFVELKKSQIGRGTKVPHLSYVGDAVVGEGTNIGAGTIFANYDGQKKHKTRVGDDVFIGSNTTLVAPITVGDRGQTGAGAVVTHDVDPETTVIGVPARVYSQNSKKKNKQDQD